MMKNLSFDKSTTHPVSGSTAVIEKPEVKKEKRIYPKYKVILHNDDINSFEYVLNTVSQVIGMSLEDAYPIVLEAHERGKSIAKVCTLEHAEHYSQGLKDKGIESTIEQE